MTVQEYQDRNASITMQISKLKAQADSYTKEAAAKRIVAQEYLNNIGNNGKGGCTGSGKKKSACEEDKLWKTQQSNNSLALAQQYESNAKKITTVEIPNLNKEFQENIKRIEEAQHTASQVSLELSKQGQTIESVRTVADANAESILRQSNAQAEATLKKAEADTSNKKKMGLIMALAGVVVIAVVGLILFKKFKKK